MESIPTNRPKKFHRTSSIKNNVPISIGTGIFTPVIFKFLRLTLLKHSNSTLNFKHDNCHVFIGQTQLFLPL